MASTKLTKLLPVKAMFPGARRNDGRNQLPAVGRQPIDIDLALLQRNSASATSSGV